MALQATDWLLVNRSGVDYKVRAGDGMLLADSDSVLVNRSGTDYRITGATLKAGSYLDTDWFLTNRGGVDYRADGASLRSLLTPVGDPPVIGSVVLSDVAGGARFTSTAFPVVTTMTDDGTPTSTKSIKAQVEGNLRLELLSTNTITALNTITASFTEITMTAAANPKSVTVDWHTMAVMPGTSVIVTAGDEEDTSGLGGTKDGRNILSYDVSQHPTTPNKVGQTNGKAYLFVVYGLGRYVAAPRTASSPCITSTTATVGSWTNTTGAATISAHCGVSTSTAIILGGDAGVHYRSTDGIAFTKLTNPSTGAITHIAAGNGVIIAGVAAGQPQISTDDGLTFTAIPTTSIPAATCGGVAFGNGKFYYARSGSRTIAVSADGVNWGTGPQLAFGQSPVGMGTFLGGVAMWVQNRQLIYTKDELSWETLIPASTAATKPSGLGVVDVNSTYLVGSLRGTGSTTAGRLVTSSSPSYTELTITGCLTDGFRAGDLVTSDPTGASGTIYQVTDAYIRLIVPKGTWAVGMRISTVRIQANATLHCVLSSTGVVTDLQATDPGFTAVTMTGSNPYNQDITFPALLPSGEEPDTELPAGVTLTTTVRATNALGSSTVTSNTITPA